MNIYFAGSIRGGRGDVDIYQGIIKHLESYGKVLTEHVGDADLSLEGEEGITDREIHDRDMSWLGDSRILVAEVSSLSSGVGYEIGRVVERNRWSLQEDRKDILCLYRVPADRKLSGMISGSDGVVNREYRDLEEACECINEFMKDLE